jgi:nicotinate-nucleotide adenylyltransferase
LSPASTREAPLGVLGGTFNPVHYGHLRSALELVELLDLAELRLMPCAIPPHRQTPGCSAAHRAAMVELAVAADPRLSCDLREVRRDGVSYTVDSLAELRKELGPERSLVMVVGGDAALGLAGWHRWRELARYAHIAVIARPGWDLPAGGEVGAWLGERRVGTPAALAGRPAGAVLVERLRPLDISSTEIRGMLARGSSPRFLLPDAVLDYIQTHGLYREAGADI